MDWIIFKIHMFEALTPNVTALGDRTFKETIKVKQGYKSEP